MIGRLCDSVTFLDGIHTLRYGTIFNNIPNATEISKNTMQHNIRSRIPTPGVLE